MKSFITVLLTLLSVFSILKAVLPNKPKSESTPHYKYLIYTPNGYNSAQKKNWPVIIYLHGKSASGNNLNELKRYGIPFFIEGGMEFSAIVVSPQCPNGKNWTTENWFEPFYNELVSKYNIDTTRIYLTGMSMGGFGTWALGIKYPNRFAALMPLCGGGKPHEVNVLRDVPVWVLHGDNDEVVPIKRSEEMVNALRRGGGNPIFTVLKGKGHDIHRQYADISLYQWMMQYTNIRNSNTASSKKYKTDTLVTSMPKLKNKNISKKRATPEQTDTLKGKEYMLVF